MLSLAIANYHQVYREADIDSALSELEATPHNAYLRKTYERMRLRGGQRFVVKPNSPDCLTDIEQVCPNFKAVVRDLKKYVALSLTSSRPLVFGFPDFPVDDVKSCCNAASIAPSFPSKQPARPAAVCFRVGNCFTGSFNR